MLPHAWKIFSTAGRCRAPHSSRWVKAFIQHTPLLGMVFVLFCCLSAHAQQPQPTPRFAFVTDIKVISLVVGEKPFSLLIQNNTTEPLIVDLKVIDVEPKVNDPISAAIKLGQPFVQLEPMASWSVSISPPAKDPASAKRTFGKGYLIAVERGKPNFDRRDIQISEPPVATTSTPVPTPAPADTLDTLTVMGTNFVPSLVSSLWSALALIVVAIVLALVFWSGYLTKRGAPLITLILIVVAAVLIGGAIWDHRSPPTRNYSLIKVRPVPFTLGKGLNAGVMTAEGSTGRIVADGTQLSVMDLPRAGSYDGSVKLGTGTEARVVKVTVKVWDWWPFALLAIICGVYVGYRMSHYFNQQRGEDALRLRVAQLWQKIVEDESRFQSEHGGRPYAAARIAEIAKGWLLQVERDVAEHKVDGVDKRLDLLETYVKLFAQFRGQLVILYELQSRVWERIKQNAFGLEREDVRVFVQADKVYSESPRDLLTDDEQGTQLKSYQTDLQALIDWIGAMELNYDAIVRFLNDATSIDAGSLVEADQNVLATQIQVLRKAARDVLLADAKDKLTTFYTSAVTAIGTIRALTDTSTGESILAPAASMSLRRGRATAGKDSEAISDIRLSSQLTSNVLALDGNLATTSDLLIFTAQVVLSDDSAESYRLKWDFGDGSASVIQVSNTAAGNRTTLQITHRYGKGGTYTPSLQKLSGETLGECNISVIQSPTRLERLLTSIRLTELQMTIVSGLLTIGLGFYTLYLAKPVWGTTADYLYAVLWGSVLSEGLKYGANIVGRIWKP